jgi:hypothetical protein
MPSSHFSNLDASIRELKRIYLEEALAAGTPTVEQQEFARAFVVLAHAEFEYFVEESLRALALVVRQQASAGQFGKASLSLLAFSGIAGLNGGESLGSRKNPRALSTRFGQAHDSLVLILDSNTGVREKFLAKMGVPLGLDASLVDSTWLSDLEAFCTFRGMYAHVSRSIQGASHLAVNPSDIWSKCSRLVWTNAAFGGAKVVNSFESFAAWVEAEKLLFGPTTIAISPRLRRLYALKSWVSARIRKWIS